MKSVRRILIINGKGGCGKTTVAINLATAYSNLGRQVAIMDCDSHASASEWLDLRPKNLPYIHLIRAHKQVAMNQTQSFHLRIPEATTHVIIDAASPSKEHNIEDLIKRSDTIVVPMLPSSIDVRAGSKFIGKLLTHSAYRRHPLPIAVVANRTRPNTRALKKLFEFLSCLDIPTVAQFSDDVLYNDTAANGTGLLDKKNRSNKEYREALEWQKLIRWIEEAGNELLIKKAQPIRAMKHHPSKHQSYQ